ncbi:MAG: FAD:protein FMN transferase [Oscillospiraceae bacterium]|nr:FAD:protein FMN transferase [Oscillospiraceae bacterium]
MKVKILFLSLVFLLSGCNKSSPPEPVSRTDFALGTFVSARVHGENAESALDEVFARLFEIEQLASAKNPDSELFYVNQNAYEREVTVSEELFYLLETGLFYSSLTDGAFDITLGSIVELWGIGTENVAVPDAEELAEALENSGFRYLVLNENELSVRFWKEGLRIDLGALAKGYAADEMKRILLENGVTNAILDLGGDIITISDNDGKGWRIGIADPRNLGEICAIVRVSDKAVVTSGDYERFFVQDGVDYHHIFDSATGFPADSGIISVTVIAESAMLADALSTAFFVMGVERAIEFARTMPEIGYILIDRDMNIYNSENIEIEIIR